MACVSALAFKDHGRSGASCTSPTDVSLICSAQHQAQASAEILLNAMRG
jgi:hypothetical protein